MKQPICTNLQFRKKKKKWTKTTQINPRERGLWRQSDAKRKKETKPILPYLNL